MSEPQVAGFLSAVSRGLIRYARWRAVAGSSAAAAFIGALGLGADALVRPTGVGMLALVGLSWLGMVAAVAIVSQRLRRLPSLADAGRAVDTAAPELEHRASAAAAVLAGERKTALAGVILRDAADRLASIDPSNVLPSGRRRLARMQALAGAAALGLVMWGWWLPAQRAVDAWRELRGNASLVLRVIPGNSKVLVGQPITLEVHTDRPAARLERTPPMFTLRVGESIQTAIAARHGDHFAITVPAVKADFEYDASVAGARSERYRVRALTPPRVTGIQIEYRYPLYAGLRPRLSKDTGDMLAPKGTVAHLRVHTDRPVVDAMLAFAEGADVALTAAGTGREAMLRLDADRSYRIRLKDADGVENPGDTEYFIRLVGDRPPEVRIVQPGADRPVTPLQEIAIEARADDDHGVASLDLVYAVRGSAEKVVPLVRGSATAVRSGTHVLALEDLDVRPGDFVTYYARARDVAKGKAASEARSDIFFLEVKPFDQQFFAALSQAQADAAMQQQRQQGNQSLQSLAATQKEIIVATWKLEQRAAAGRSAADVRSLAEAQRTLRERVERQATGSAAGRGRGLGGVAPASLPAAVEAMRKAEERLAALATSEALPFENEAFNQLLRADAEIRERMVAQQRQQGGGGGGAQQGNEDLSALFDRELQRQNQTNYETRQSAESAPQASAAEAESDAMRRLRELAARQEAWRRQQAALSADPEERKRQLERLTREQQQMAEEADRLAQTLAAQERQSQQSSRQGQPQQASRSGAQSPSTSESVRDAARHMREGAGQASQSSDRAREASARAEQQLRQAERELDAAREAGSPANASRLRTEMSQLAEAQRQAAGRAQALAQQSATGESAGRHQEASSLADDRARLAARARTLTRQLVDETTRDSRSELAPAARGMTDQRIADRLGEQARQWQGVGSAGDASRAQVTALAEREETLARELDGLAGRAQSGPPSARAGSAEADRVTRELDRLQRLNMEMRSLERQIDELSRRLAERPANEREAPANQARLRELAERFDQRAGEARPNRDTPVDARTLSRSAPGSEPWKQDYAKWTELRKGIHDALEAREGQLLGALAEHLALDKAQAGDLERLPDTYRQWIARYYERLARPAKAQRDRR